MTHLSEKYSLALSKLRNHHASGATHPRSSRIENLRRLEQMIRENSDEICRALHEDLRKPKQEALISEIAVTIEEIGIAIKYLKRWMRPKTVRSPLSLWPSTSRIFFEPLGVVLIIGPWNYPFQLLIAPLVGAIAAGNCAMVKPSEHTPQTSALVKKLIEDYFSPDLIHVETGGVPETTELLDLKFDHIFFTGSTAVGKIVMQAAAKNLVPVTLELGGKSPVIVCDDADLDLAARRIVWGKFYNAGQTCVAPDYLYVQEKIADELLEKVIAHVQAQFGEQPAQSNDFGRIINSRSTERLATLIDPEKIAIGGQVDIQQKYVAPTILRNVQWTDKIMTDEIFGPILPVLTFKELEETIKQIQARPKPLAAYLFSRSKELQQKFISNLRFGGGCINDVVVHLSNPYLPFGGVGGSGMGHYHGEASFKTFSHSKSIVFRTGWFDFSARYAPYSDKKLRLLKRIFGI